MTIYHYTYLITNLNPLTEQKYYIGVRSSKCLPQDDPYMGSSKVLLEEINVHGNTNYSKEILQEWPSREEALSHEVELHKFYDVKNNEMFYNLVNQTTTKFTLSNLAIDKAKATKNDPEWKATTGVEQSRKHIETVNDPNWKATTGRKAVLKRKATMETVEWQESMGKEQSAKMKKTKNDPEWKETIGKEQSTKMKDTFNDPTWLATVGVVKIERLLKTRSDPLWKATTGKNAKEKELKTKLSSEWKETIGKEQVANYTKLVNSTKWKETIGKEKSDKLKKTKRSPEWLKANTHTCHICQRVIVGNGNIKKHLKGKHNVR